MVTVILQLECRDSEVTVDVFLVLVHSYKGFVPRAMGRESNFNLGFVNGYHNPVLICHEALTDVLTSLSTCGHSKQVWLLTTESARWYASSGEVRVHSPHTITRTSCKFRYWYDI